MAIFVVQTVAVKSVENWSEALPERGMFNEHDYIMATM
jgi:hypothetical protein